MIFLASCSSSKATSSTAVVTNGPAITLATAAPATIAPATIAPATTATPVATTTLAPTTTTPEVYYQSPSAFAAKAEQIATTEKFPLVVYSHGSGGLRYIHSSYTEALASNGYVVVAPDHTGNTAVERITNASAPANEIAFNRPQDVRHVIDAFLDPAHPTAGPYALHVDADKVVVTGH